MCREFFKTICYILFILTFILIDTNNLQAREVSNSEIKASWIYTIIDWLDWKNRPKNTESVICTIGRDKVNMYLNKIKRKTKQQNNQKDNNLFSVKNKSPSDNFSECYILYISDSEQDYYTDILDKVNQNKNILTVSSIRGFARRGGTIEFVIKKKARLVINLRIARDAQIIIDDKLYGWAETVH